MVEIEFQNIRNVAELEESTTTARRTSQCSLGVKCVSRLRHILSSNRSNNVFGDAPTFFRIAGLYEQKSMA